MIPSPEPGVSNPPSPVQIQADDHYPTLYMAHKARDDIRAMSLKDTHHTGLQAWEIVVGNGAHSQDQQAKAQTLKF